MKLATIEVPREKAREAWLEYREAVRDKRHASHVREDEAIMVAYRALSRGQRVVRLTEALRAGGTMLLSVPNARWVNGRGFVSPEEVELPRLAIARADTTRVWCRGIGANGDIRMITRPERELHWRNRRDVFERSGVFPLADRGTASGPVAIVPTIPPKLRPKRTRLSEFHVLFEAEWGIDPEAPTDPALLRHLGGDLYAVVAVWDLTEVERAVLAITR